MEKLNQDIELVLFAEEDANMLGEEQIHAPSTSIQNGGEEYNDDEDDGITITIGPLGCGESDKQRIQLNKEILQLVEQSLHTNLMGPTISFIVDNKFIICDNSVSISPALQNIIWKPNLSIDLQTKPILPQNHDLLERKLQEFVKCNYQANIIHANEIVGFLGSYYVKMGNYNFRRMVNSSNPLLSSLLSSTTPIVNDDLIVSTKIGCEAKKYFTEFCLIVYNRLTAQIMDYAIHGRIGNVNNLIVKYKLKKILYNDASDNQLYNFLTHPCSPFYPNMNSCLVPLKPHPNQGTINTLAFCPINSPYCAFCKTLQTMFGFFARKGYDHLYTRENLSANSRPQLTIEGWFRQTTPRKKDRIRKSVTANPSRMRTKKSCISLSKNKT